MYQTISRRNNISADDLARDGAKKREQKALAKQKAQEELEKKNKQDQKFSDQKRVFQHVTRWYDWRYVFLFGMILSLFSALPFFSMWLSMEDLSSFDPTGFLQFFMFWFIVHLILFVLAIRMIPVKVEKEKEWIEGLPWKMIAYPDLFVYRSYPSVKLAVAFKRKKPDQQYFMDLFGALPYTIEHEIERQTPKKETSDELLDDVIFGLRASDEPQAETNTFLFELNNPAASKFNRHRRWARKWIHNICDVHFSALHQDYPIESITFVNGTKELDFDWWIPLKKLWWLRF